MVLPFSVDLYTANATHGGYRCTSYRFPLFSIYGKGRHTLLSLVGYTLKRSFTFLFTRRTKIYR